MFLRIVARSCSVRRIAAIPTAGISMASLAVHSSSSVNSSMSSSRVMESFRYSATPVPSSDLTNVPPVGPVTSPKR
jgi:hypothetical protein